MRWSTGETTVERLLAAGHIEGVQGSRRTETPGLNGRAVAWKRRVAVLAQQGLRPTTAGSHHAIGEAVRAQFGPVLKAFGGLRRRRNELEYPLYPTEQANAEEASAAFPGSGQRSVEPDGSGARQRGPVGPASGRLRSLPRERHPGRPQAAV